MIGKFGELIGSFSDGGQRVVGESPAQPLARLLNQFIANFVRRGCLGYGIAFRAFRVVDGFELVCEPSA